MLKRLAFAFVVFSMLLAGALLYVDGHFPASTPSGEEPIDYRPFAAALSHVSQSGLVDYAALRKDRGPLEAFLAQLARVSPINRPDLFEDPEARLAFWLNAYHALALDAALDSDSDRALDWLGRSFFWSKSWPIGGRRFTLWAVERRFLRETGDSRVPFALACGALGCALLDGSPYQADTLDAQLNDAVSRFVQNPRNMKLLPDGVHLSPLFQVNEADIQAALPEGRTNLLQFVWAFLPEACDTRPGCDTRGDLDKACGPTLDKCAIRYERFDWQLASRP